MNAIAFNGSSAPETKRFLNQLRATAGMVRPQKTDLQLLERQIQEDGEAPPNLFVGLLEGLGIGSDDELAAEGWLEGEEFNTVEAEAEAIESYG